MEMSEHSCLTACASVSGYHLVSSLRLAVHQLLAQTDAHWCSVASNLSSELDMTSQYFLSYKIELIPVLLRGFTL